MSRTRLHALAVACALAACSKPPSQTDAPVTTPPKPTAVEAAPASAPAAAEASQATDTQATSYVLPGDFAPDTSVASLRERFGAEQVQVGEVPGAEGEMFRGVILFPDDTTRRAYLYFQDEKALRGLSLIRVFESDTRWRLATGVSMGMPLAELVRRNGQPIEYSGLEWDYGGSVSDLHGGALAPPEDTAVRSHWRLGPAEREEGYPDNAYPVGDSMFSSDDPRYPRQGEFVVVRELSVSFPGEDDL